MYFHKSNLKIVKQKKKKLKSKNKIWLPNIMYYMSIYYYILISTIIVVDEVVYRKTHTNFPCIGCPMSVRPCIVYLRRYI